MLYGVDSSYARPTPAIAAQAKAAGIGVWGGYIATKAGVRIAAPWPKSDFDIVKNAGMSAIGFCSGYDDPIACKATAAAWGVLLILDVESSIRGDGAWVQSWLDAAGCGLYGNLPVFAGRTASCYVVAAYPGGTNPGTTWPPGKPGPAGPRGWQWQGTHDFMGLGVDSANYDDWFAQNGPPPGADDPLEEIAS